VKPSITIQLAPSRLMPSCVRTGLGLFTTTPGVGAEHDGVGRRAARREIEARVVAGPHDHLIAGADQLAARCSVRHGVMAPPSALSLPVGAT
jgi:hypothetical protein